MSVAPVARAHARASVVFPVPGGPYSSTDPPLKAAPLHPEPAPAPANTHARAHMHVHVQQHATNHNNKNTNTHARQQPPPTQETEKAQ
jgi:hypothetical protein